MNISIGGNLGSGKTTVSKLLAEKLNMVHIYAGKIMRNIAMKRGISLIELQKTAITNKNIDSEVDKEQKRIGIEEDNYIIEGQLGYYFAPSSLKIFLKVDPMEAARRIFNDKTDIRKTETYNESVQKTFDSMNERINLTRERWKKVYDTDCQDESNFNFVIDTTNIPAEEVAQKIIDYVQKSSKSLS